MTITEFLRARLAEDEQIAQSAIGARGRAAGATVQHWRWERAEDDDVLSDGSAPIARQFMYPEGEVTEGVIADRVALRTVEQYPTTSVGDLSDFVLPDVEEPTAGAAQHIARHDPARVLADVEAKRALVDYWSRAFQNPIDADKFPGHDWDLVRGAARWTLRHLATPYASHPDYQAYWAL